MKKITWNDIGHFLGHLIGATMAFGAWAIILLFILKCVWFILFRFLV